MPIDGVLTGVTAEVEVVVAGVAAAEEEPPPAPPPGVGALEVSEVVVRGVGAVVIVYVPAMVGV